MRARLILGLTRAAIGAFCWAAPPQAATMLGVHRDRSSDYVMRLFGVRDLALGLALLLARDKTVRTVALVGLAVDVTDAVSGVQEGRSGAMDRKATAMATGGALGAVGLGVLTLWSTRRSKAA